MKILTAVLFLIASALLNVNASSFRVEDEESSRLSHIEQLLQSENTDTRSKRNADRGVTNLDIRAAILQLVNVIRDGSKKTDKANFDIQNKLKSIESHIKSG